MGRTVKELTQEHRNIAYLRAQGATHNAIAEQTGYSAAHVKVVLRNPQVAELVDNERLNDTLTGNDKTVREVVDRAKLKAILLLEQVVTDSPTLKDHSPTMKQRVDAAIEILGMAGHSSKHIKVDHEHTHVLRPADMDLIATRAALLPPIEVKAIEIR